MDAHFSSDDAKRCGRPGAQGWCVPSTQGHRAALFVVAEGTRQRHLAGRCGNGGPSCALQLAQRSPLLEDPPIMDSHSWSTFQLWFHQPGRKSVGNIYPGDYKKSPQKVPAVSAPSPSPPHSARSAPASVRGTEVSKHAESREQPPGAPAAPPPRLGAPHHAVPAHLTQPRRAAARSGRRAGRAWRCRPRR